MPPETPPSLVVRRSRFKPLKTQEIIDRGRQMLGRVPVALRLVVAASALVALLSANALLAFRAGEQVFAQQEQLRQALRAEKDLTALLSLSKDIETGIRGYFVTGDRRFLEPYRAALDGLPPLVASVTHDMSSEARQADLAARLDRELARLIVQSSSFLRVRAEKGDAIDLAQFRPLVEDQKDVMDRLRRVAEVLREDYAQSTEVLDAQLRELRQEQQLLIVLPNVLLLALALFIFAILLRENRTGQLIAIEREKSLSIEREARSEAEAANQAKDDFVSVVSHELRTPLQAILGWTQFLARAIEPEEPVPTEPMRAPVQSMQRAAHTLARMIDDLLDVSRALTGKLTLQPQALDFAELVRETLETLAPTAASKRVRLVSAVATGKLGLVGDPERLRQVVTNIVGNAIKFTPAEGQVVVAAQRSESAVELRVRDTGIGIAADLLPRIFDRYVQASSTSTRQYGGLGLGLAIVKHLVEMHGGQVHADSAGPGQGAEFLVRLPIAAVAPLADPPRRNDLPLPETLAGGTSARPAGSAARLSNQLVMVVDDDSDVRNVLTLLLGEEGAKVVVAASAREALDLLARSPIDVVISDIGMPEMDGYAFGRALRQASAPELQRHRDVPLVALTAFSRPDDLRRARDAGFNEHLAKPVEFERLVEILSRFRRVAAPAATP